MKEREGEGSRGVEIGDGRNGEKTGAKGLRHRAKERGGRKGEGGCVRNINVEG